MKKIGEALRELVLIDEDVQGGFGRVASAQYLLSQANQGEFKKVAVKILRKDVGWDIGIERFSEEIEVLANIFGRVGMEPNLASRAPNKLLGYGFVETNLASALENRLDINPEWQLLLLEELSDFHTEGKKLNAREPGLWRPFILLEPANYDDCLFRMIFKYPRDNSDFYRLPTGELILLSIQLLDTLSFFHANGRVYLDWKPEHVFWDGFSRSAKLVDWNTTSPIDHDPGYKQNIKDDIRLFCGAILYSGLTMVDLQGKQLGAQPTTASPLIATRARFQLAHDVIFYNADRYLDKQIKDIVRKGLDPNNGFEGPSELKATLIEYAESQLGVNLDFSANDDPYLQSLVNLREAQKALSTAYSNISNAIYQRGTNEEFERLRKILIKAQDNLVSP